MFPITYNHLLIMLFHPLRIWLPSFFPSYLLYFVIRMKTEKDDTLIINRRCQIIDNHNAQKKKNWSFFTNHKSIQNQASYLMRSLSYRSKNLSHSLFFSRMNISIKKYVCARYMTLMYTYIKSQHAHT